MWYIIQTKTGEEERVVELMGSTECIDLNTNFLLPKYEHVRRSATKYNIYYRKLFPGYIFIETAAPKELILALRKVPEFTRLLGTDEEDADLVKQSEKELKDSIIGVEEQDMRFLESVLTDGILHVSFIKMHNSRIEKVIGPLAGYAGHITKLDVQHRRAIVEKEIFGKRRKIYFGLCTEADPVNTWIQKLIDCGDPGRIIDQEYDIGIKPGDKVRNFTGLYRDKIFVVKTVNAKKRLFTADSGMLGDGMIEMSVDEVEVV